MGSLQKPEMILSIINTAGVVGLAFYTYKKDTALANQINDLEGKLKLNVQKVVELDKTNNDYNENIANIFDRLEQLRIFVHRQEDVITSYKKELVEREADINKLQKKIKGLTKTVDKYSKITDKLRITIKEELRGDTNKNGTNSGPETEDVLNTSAVHNEIPSIGVKKNVKAMNGKNNKNDKKNRKKNKKKKKGSDKDSDDSDSDSSSSDDPKSDSSSSDDSSDSDSSSSSDSDSDSSSSSDSTELSKSKKKGKEKNNKKGNKDKGNKKKKDKKKESKKKDKKKDKKKKDNKDVGATKKGGNTSSMMGGKEDDVDDAIQKYKLAKMK